MDILVISDLHTEGYNGKTDVLKEFLSKNVDVLVIAGDLTTFLHLETTIKFICERTKHLVYVTGNREYYYSSFEEVDDLLGKLSLSLNNFHWLHDTAVRIPFEINGQNDNLKFLGNTLWFPRTPETTNPFNQQLKQDFYLIKGFEPKVYEKHLATVKYLEENAKLGDIIVTHHAPSERSIHQKFLYSSINCYFVSSQENIIEKCKPQMWIHGHTHDFFDYTIGSTRILCNPFGYKDDHKNYLNRSIPLHPLEKKNRFD